MLIFCATTIGSPSGQKEAKSLKLVTQDQKEIRATYLAPSAVTAPGVILLPDTRCDRNASFGGFMNRLHKAGLAVLATDFRYKNLIARAGSRQEQINLIKEQDLDALITYDTKSALDFLRRQDGVDHTRIACLGTSLGARVALIAGVRYGLNALVLLSLSGPDALPGRSVKNLLDDYGDRPILFMTAERDWGNNFKAAEDNQRYSQWAKGKNDLKIWPGSGHGASFLESQDAVELILSWLHTHL